MTDSLFIAKYNWKTDSLVLRVALLSHICARTLMYLRKVPKLVLFSRRSNAVIANNRPKHISYPWLQVHIIQSITQCTHDSCCLSQEV